MSSYVLPRQLTPTVQGRAAVLQCSGATSLMITVTTPVKGTAGAEDGLAGSVYYELGFGYGATPQWEGQKRSCLPGTTTRGLACDWVRVWAMAADAPQFVSIEADG
ncbi:MAG TPA: hypothetical protein VN962_26860 [Polyangia bacterium]|nr:hypothetical protein [Polyangia bacterium]